MNKDFVIFGQYIINGIIKNKKIEIFSLNLNPQNVIGAKVDAKPEIEKIKNNELKIIWKIKKLKGDDKI